MMLPLEKDPAVFAAFAGFARDAFDVDPRGGYA